MLLSLGSPLPDDAVSAVRGESGMLGRLSVPLRWGVAVPPDAYDHPAPKPEAGADAGDEAVDGLKSRVAADGINEWSGWEGEPEPRFDMPRTGSVVPHSPAAG